MQALREVDVTVEVGEMVAFVGPSRSGKRTLMHILGLLRSPDRDYDPPPSLVFDGTDVTELRGSRVHQDASGADWFRIPIVQSRSDANGC